MVWIFFESHFEHLFLNLQNLLLDTETMFSSSLITPSPHLSQVKTSVASAVMIRSDRQTVGRTGYNQLTRAAKHRVAGLIACSVVGYKRAIIEAVTRTCYPPPFITPPYSNLPFHHSRIPLCCWIVFNSDLFQGLETV